MSQLSVKGYRDITTDWEIPAHIPNVWGREEGDQSRPVGIDLWIILALDGAERAVELGG